MTTIHLTVRGADAQAAVSGVLTGGMVGLPILFHFDSTWDGLSRTLVCRGGGRQVSITGVGTQATVPHEVLCAGSTLFLGVEGRNAEGTLVIPTVWVNCGVIQEGAVPNEVGSVDPAAPIWAQLQQQIGCLEDLNTQEKADLVRAVNEIMGFTDTLPGIIDQFVTEYLQANPVQEQDPTVPQWAKAAEKPIYTAQEVGAEAQGAVNAAVTAHNADTAAHADIRQAIPTRLSGLSNDLYTSLPLVITYQDGSTETVNLAVSV